MLIADFKHGLWIYLQPFRNLDIYSKTISQDFMRVSYLVLLSILISMSSCKKAELKKPTRINFKFDLNKSDNQNPLVKITNADINISTFNVSGDRVEGEDIAFTRNFAAGEEIEAAGQEVRALDYDVPQGEYQQLQVDFNIPDKGTDPSIILRGNYKPNIGGVKALRFEYYGMMEMYIDGEDENENSTIIFDKKVVKKATVELDAIHWFSSLSTNELDNATITSQQGQDVILLSPTSNISLYNIVAERMTESNKVIFK
jgi:hypothetical protein